MRTEGTELPEVHALRGFAAGVVVLFHGLIFVLLSGRAFPDTFVAHVANQGWVGVDFFFVLSGFLLAGPLLRRPDLVSSSRYWGRYLLARWMRIAPPYLVAILLALVLTGNLRHLRLSNLDVWLHVTFLHNLRLESLLSINSVFWTLAVEFQFYLVMPIFAVAFVRRRWLVTLPLAVLVALAWRAWSFTPGDPATSFWLSGQLPGFLLHFALGVLVARVRASGVRLPGPHPAWVLLAGASIVVLSLRAFADFPQGGPAWDQPYGSTVLLRPLLAVGFAAILLGILQWGPHLRPTIRMAGFDRLGKMSYSLYLVHVPVGFFLVGRFPGLLGLGFLGFLAIYGAVCLAMTLGFYFMVERPLLRLRKSLVARTPDPTPVAAGPA